MSQRSTPSQGHGWQQTALWKVLDKNTAPEADACKSLLKRWMPTIETLLAKAGTAPSDFTLHDAHHGFRVSHQMADLIPDDVLPQLCPYELVQLLLSAYLHDVGMTPNQAKVTLHYNYLLSGVGELPLADGKTKLSESEIDEFSDGWTTMNGVLHLPSAKLPRPWRSWHSAGN